MHNKIEVVGAKENNLKNVSLLIDKHKVNVVTGVSGSGKSSLVFDSIYAYAQSQFYETLSTYVVKNLPKINTPNVDSISNLSPCVLIEQKKLGTNPRSTVGTYTELYTYLRLLYSRVGLPIYDSAYFSFNNSKGACLVCGGLGTELTIDLNKLIDFNLSLNEGAIKHRTWKVGSRYFNIQSAINYFDMDKKIKDYSEEELNMLLYKEPTNYMNKASGFVQNFSYEGIVSRLLKRQGDSRGLVINDYDKTFFSESICHECLGSRLNENARSVLVNGKSLVDLLNIEITDLKEFLISVDDIHANDIKAIMLKMIERLEYLGVGYLSLNRGINTLSNGESQKLKLAKSMGNSLNELIYIMDEPTQGFHSRDVSKIINAVKNIVDNSNTAIVVEHNREFIESADNIIDVGPQSGTNGGEIIYNGPLENFKNVDRSLTLKYLNNKLSISDEVKEIKEYYEVKNVVINNIKGIDVKIPKNMLTVITGVSGSGKSSLVKYLINNDPSIIKVGRDNIGISSRSNVATYSHIFDTIRNLFANSSNMKPGDFSFNSTGACPACGGNGSIKMDMHFLGDVTQVCDECHGKRYKNEILEYKYNGKNISEVLDMTLDDASVFFKDIEEISRRIDIMLSVGLGYLKLGQTLDTLSGGEVQRLNMTDYLSKKGNIYIFDEPTQGLHLKDIEELRKVMKNMIDKGNTIIVIEHNLDLICGADYIIDMGPDAGKCGGKIVFEGYLKDIIDKDTYTAKSIKKYIG